MKNTIKFIASSAVLASAGATFAAGSHAGGHGHGTEAIGKPGVAAKATRTVQIDMTDNMRFTPDTVTVRRGETVRFVVKNSGKLKHEFNLGTEKDLREHYEMMKKFPEMEHDEPNIASVEPGQTGEVIWQFTKAGTVNFACLHPGHYEAGMKGAVKVGAGK
ncbi:MAG: cupredoxin family protein [Rhodoferax sp.]|uniref:cupredoxin domain-containing protein n=1 Tax=Rhodoferax sp. TaxID=50421 RepID=UPI002ACDAFA4|nr:cupredoxin family protein [Rhodoferax sp.]MDZ7890546.1 cupredoxin family protein [Rhodoferax sp.]